jgi:hypothetical protein
VLVCCESPPPDLVGELCQEELLAAELRIQVEQVQGCGTQGALGAWAKGQRAENRGQRAERRGQIGGSMRMGRVPGGASSRIMGMNTAGCRGGRGT